MSNLRRLLPASLPLVAGAAALWAVPALLPRPDASAAPADRPAAAAVSTPAAGAAQAAPAVDPASLSDAVATAAERISPSVVNIRVEAVQRSEAVQLGPFQMAPPQEGVVRGGGTGVILRADGYVLTNNHVVENAMRIDVHLRDGRRLEARVVGTDPAIDLAVLKVEATDLVPARFATSDAARVGQWVVAVGSPFGLDYTVTAGVLSATGRGGLGANEIEDYLQTDASINPGNSGGPLVDLRGEVLGINTMIIGRASGIGFAIPSDLARHVADQIVADGRVRRAWLGVSFQEMTPELAAYFTDGHGGGALINEVVADGPAGRAGIRPGDVIVAIEGQRVADGHELLRNLLRRGVGQRLRVDVLRERRTQTIEITTAERPESQRALPRLSANGPAQAAPRTGLSLVPLDDFLRQRLGYSGPARVVVREVEPGSNADHAGLSPGDLLLSVDRRPATEPDDVKRGLADDGRALLEVQRRDRRFFTVLEAAR
ncbi:MAG: trypsin-like peptidase domain-containing protein [Polyangiales bacterium]